MFRHALPLVIVLAACDAGSPPPPPAPPSEPAPGAATAGPWINTDDQAPLSEKLARWKGKRPVLLEFSFLK